MKTWKPWVFENSKIPVILSRMSPINIWAVSIFIFVFCRGNMDTETHRHETIHFQQQLELLFIFQWILYGLFWLVGIVKYRNGRTAYFQNPFEQEAYDKESVKGYLIKRKRYSWTRYRI